MREITEAVDLCDARGNLNPGAVGWTRSPLHRTPLTGWGRNKRWEYWGIVTPRHVIGTTISSLDYAGVHQLYVYDRASGEEWERGAVVPLARGTVLPDTLPPFTAQAQGRGHHLAFADRSGGTRLTARIGELELDAFAVGGVEHGGPAESLGVVVPWSRRRFQYTLKGLTRPVTGRITVAGVPHEIPPGSFAVLDRGRGRWPYEMTWNWAAGSGVVDGVPLGLQLGGKWTDRTGATENALFVAGVAHHIGEELSWDYDLTAPMRPWRVRGERVDATLTPFHVRVAKTSAVVVTGTTQQAFGTWSGWAVDDAGDRHCVDGLGGWAEQAHNRW